MGAMQTGSKSTTAVRLEDCPPQLARALQRLDGGDHTIDCLAVEEALRSRNRLRWQNLLIVALLALSGLLLVERASFEMAPLELGARRAMQSCPPEATPSNASTPPANTTASSATPPTAAAAPTAATTTANSSSNGTATSASNSSDSGSTSAGPTATADAQAGGLEFQLDLELPELFAYVWVLGGSLCVCCSVILFIHRGNAIYALPCFKCLKGG